MIVSEQELYDYMNCPLHHYFKHVKAIPDLTSSEKSLYKKSIESVIRSFYFSLMDERFLSPHDLKMKWQAACSNLGYKPETEDTKKGLATLLQFHDWAKDNCGVGFDIDREFLLPFNENKLHSKLPIVRQKFDKTIDILHLKFWNATIDAFKVETDIAFPLSILGFYSVYKTMPDSLTVFNCKTGKEILLRFTKEDCERVQAATDNVIKAMEGNIKYPRWNINCSTCPYKPHCRAWRG